MTKYALALVALLALAGCSLNRDLANGSVNAGVGIPSIAGASASVGGAIVGPVAKPEATPAPVKTYKPVPPPEK